MMARDAGFIAALASLLGDSRALLLVCLLPGRGVVAAARLAGMGDATARAIAATLEADGMTYTGRHGITLLNGAGKRAALAAIQPLRAALMAGASQDEGALF